MRWLLLGLLFAVPASLFAQQGPPDKSKPASTKAIRLSDIPDNQKALDSFPQSQRPVTAFDYVLNRIGDAAERKAEEVVSSSSLLLKSGIERTVYLDGNVVPASGGVKYVRPANRIVVGLSFPVRKVAGPWEQACQGLAESFALSLFSGDPTKKDSMHVQSIDFNYFPRSWSSSQDEREVHAAHEFAEAIASAVTIRVVLWPLAREERDTWRVCTFALESGSFAARSGKMRAMLNWGEE